MAYLFGMLFLLALAGGVLYGLVRLYKYFLKPPKVNW